MTINVLKMVRRQLRELGADGLCNQDSGCCCLLPNISECWELPADCVAAKKKIPLAGNEMIPMKVEEEKP